MGRTIMPEGAKHTSEAEWMPWEIAPPPPLEEIEFKRWATREFWIGRSIDFLHPGFNIRDVYWRYPGRGQA
jgi:hypothetical protein